MPRTASGRPAKGGPKGNARNVPRNRRITAASKTEAPAPAAPPAGKRRTPVRWDRLAARLRRLGKPVAILALLSAVVYGGVLAHRFVVQSPHFYVKRVEVTPTVHVTAEEVRALAGIGPRQNIFGVSLTLVARRVERHPWIARAVAHRRLPDAIRIEVTEHEAAGAVLLEGPSAAKNAFYLVNAKGRIFKQARLPELEGLPLLTGLTRGEYRRRKDESHARVREALAVAKRYLAVPGRPKLGEVHLDPVEGVTLYTASQAVQVRLGRGQIALKLRRLDRVLAELAAQGQRPRAIRLDNTRHPRRVTVQLAEADDAGGLGAP